MEDAQAAVDAWREDYNTMRPHQSLNMAFPAARFTAPAGDGLGLRIPVELTGQPQLPAAAGEPEPDGGGGCAAPAGPRQRQRAGKAVKLDRLVPPSGNLWIAGQQVWLGPAMTGRTVRLWAGLKQIHVLLDGHRIKTCRPGSMPATWPASPPRERSPPGRRRCPRHAGT